MIRVQGLTKRFRGKDSTVLALDSVDLEVQDGEFFVMLGPSGSGKTTLLRSVAGLERPDEGEIHLGDRAVFSSANRVEVPPESRGLGMVFQSYAIWPHMTVFQNVALPLREGKFRIPKREIAERVNNALVLVGLEGMEARPAPLLSGGQQQRVALARALAVEPSVMLMDEPLSNLDARLREEVRGEIKALTTKIGVTTLYVTHDQEEAMELADRIAVMDQGHILQIGTAEELYLQPAHTKVAEFLGSANWLPGTKMDPQAVETSLGVLQVATAQAREFPSGQAVTVAIRPEAVRVTSGGSSAASSDKNSFEGTVTSAVYFGDHRLYRLKVGELTLLAKLPFDHHLAGKIRISIPPEDILIFPGQSDATAAGS
jgi:iron(III) transport system ATP-binding protein